MSIGLHLKSPLTMLLCSIVRLSFAASKPRAVIFSLDMYVLCGMHFQDFMGIKHLLWFLRFSPQNSLKVVWKCRNGNAVSTESLSSESDVM